MAIRNESEILEQSVLALAQYTDALVVLDDASTDNSQQVLLKLKDACRIEKIIKKEEWVRDERADKNALLKAGREIGGTHFIMLDADEMFSALCAQNQWLRKKILALKRGQALTFPMMNVWNGVKAYRDDELCNPRQWRWRIGAAWCDDGICDYNTNPAGGVSGKLHVYRIPRNRTGDVKVIPIVDLNYGLIHFKHANLENIDIKKVWYMCLEFIGANKKAPAEYRSNAHRVNQFYQAEFALWSTRHVYTLKKVPKAWLAYDFFDESCFLKKLDTKQQDILAWFKEYGVDYFAPLAIWHFDWVQELKAQASVM